MRARVRRADARLVHVAPEERAPRGRRAGGGAALDRHHDVRPVLPRRVAELAGAALGAAVRGHAAGARAPAARSRARALVQEHRDPQAIPGPPHGTQCLYLQLPLHNVIA